MRSAFRKGTAGELDGLRTRAAQKSLNPARNLERGSRAALGFVAGLAAAVALWFGWIYYLEFQVERQEALVSVLDLKLQAQRLLIDAPPDEIRLSKGPDRSPPLGPLGQLSISSNVRTLWKKQAQMAMRRYWELTLKDLTLAAELRDLGLPLLLSGNPMDALLVLTADGSRPSDPDFLNDLGAARLRVGPLSEAQADLREALRLRPYYKKSVYNLALALETAGEREQAVAKWLEYLSIDPQSDWAAHAQRRLAALERRS